jgi:TRAP-type C4-dicarboxylate transport system permease small subunit
MTSRTDSRPPQAEARPAPALERVLLEEVVAVACMVLLVLLTLANVVVRYFTDESFAATEEISIALMLVMTVAGASAAAARDRHIRIEYFYETGSAGRRRLFALVSAGVSTVFFVLLALLCARVVWDEIRYEETTMALGLPRWWFSMWVPLLCLAIAARCAAIARRVHRGLLLPGGDAGPGAPPPDAGGATR